MTFLWWLQRYARKTASFNYDSPGNIIFTWQLAWQDIRTECDLKPSTRGIGWSRPSSSCVAPRSRLSRTRNWFCKTRSSWRVNSAPALAGPSARGIFFSAKVSGSSSRIYGRIRERRLRQWYRWIYFFFFLIISSLFCLINHFILYGKENISGKYFIRSFVIYRISDLIWKYLKAMRRFSWYLEEGGILKRTKQVCFRFRF